MKVNIAKALKLKNRLGSRIKKVQAKILQWNSNAKTTNVPVDVLSEFEEWIKLKNLIKEVSVAIYKSNATICDLLKEISEQKQTISFLSDLDTREGVVNPSRYSEATESIEYVATFGYNDVEEMKDEAEERVREIQDLLDDHNAKTYIEIPDAVGDYK
jgi:hypothetical protein